MKRSPPIDVPFVGSVLLSSFFLSQPIQAQQIIPDGTLGPESSTLSPGANNRSQIGGGAMRGTNLFHSFERFNVESGEQVYFVNPVEVETIITRVTGPEPSNIHGTLGIEGPADLWLINPQGISFGPGGTLDLQGSFVASTADAIALGNQGQYSAVAPHQSQLLSVKPTALFSNAVRNYQRQLNIAGTMAIPHNLNLQGDLVTIADTGKITTGQGLRLVGEQTLTIGQTQINSGSDLTLAAPNPILNRGNYQSQGNFTVQGALVGLSPGTITAQGDINLPLYQGTTLNLAAGKNLNFGQGKFNPQSTINFEAQGNLILNGISTSQSTINLTSSASSVTINNMVNPQGQVLISSTENINLHGAIDLQAPLAPNSPWFAGNGGTLTMAAGQTIALDAGSGVRANGLLGGGINLKAGRAINLTASALQSTTVTPQENLTSSAITLNAPQLNLNHSSQVITGTLGNSNGGDIKMEAQQSLAIDASRIAFGVLNANARGNGGNLMINAPYLGITNGSLISSDSLGLGHGGNINILARDTVVVDGADPRGEPTRISFSTAGINSFGDGGNLNLETKQLKVTNGGQILGSTLNNGNAGNLNITAQAILVDGFSKKENFNPRLSSIGLGAFSRRSTGNGGNLSIDTDEIIVSNGGLVGSGTIGSGNGGNFRLNAREIIVDGGGEVSSITFDDTEVPVSNFGNDDPLASSFLGVGVFAGSSTGNGGSLNIKADRLAVTHGAILGGGTVGIGNGSDITIESKQVFVNGQSPRGSQFSLLSVGSILDAQGSSGSFTLITEEIEVSQGGIIGAISEGAGSAGNVNIWSDRVLISDRGEITVSSFVNGAGGNLSIKGNNLLMQGGRLTAETNRGDRGNINLDIHKLISLDGGSLISAQNTGLGKSGNIDLRSQFLIAIPNTNNDIIASALNGGNITLETQGIFGLKFQELLTDRSDITATGLVESNVLDVDPSGVTVDLSTEILDAHKILNQGNCKNTAQGNSFVVTGKGGLPPSPYNALSNIAGLVEWSDGIPTPGSPNLVQHPERESTSSHLNMAQLQQAQGIQIAQDGTILLTAAINPEDLLPQPPHLSHPSCTITPGRSPQLSALPVPSPSGL